MVETPLNGEREGEAVHDRNLWGQMPLYFKLNNDGHAIRISQKLTSQGKVIPVAEIGTLRIAAEYNPDRELFEVTTYNSHGQYLDSRRIRLTDVLNYAVPSAVDEVISSAVDDESALTGLVERNSSNGNPGSVVLVSVPAPTPDNKYRMEGALAAVCAATLPNRMDVNQYHYPRCGRG